MSERVESAAGGETGAMTARRSLGRRIVEGLDPVRLFVGPVFQRDMRVMGRKRGTYWSRGAYALALCVFVSLFFVAILEESQSSRGSVQVQRLQDLAPMLALAVGWFQLIGVLLIAPVLTSPAICDEKRNKTAAALATSPLTAAQILCSNLASRMVQLVILMLTAAPLLLALRVFGGLEVETVVGISAITLSTGVLAASLGLWGSVHAKRASSAAAYALTWCVGISLLPLIVLLVNVTIRGSVSGPGGVWGWNYAVMMSPPFALASTSVPGMMFAGVGIGPLWAMNSLSNLLVSAVVLGVASAQLRRVLLREAAESPPGPEAPAGVPGSPRRTRSPSGAIRAMAGAIGAARWSKSARALVFLFGLVGPGIYFVQQVLTHDEPWAGPLIAAALLVVLSAAFLAPLRRARRLVSDAPVLWREMRQTAFGSWKFTLAAAILGAALLATAYSNGGASDDDFSMVLGVILTLILILQTAAAAGNAVAGEVQARTWHVLLTTPLSGREVLVGKVAGVVRRAWPPAAVLGVHCAFMLARGQMHIIGVVFAAWVMLSAAVFLASIGTALSLWLRRTTPATIWTVVIGLALWAALPGTAAGVIEGSGIGMRNGSATAVLFNGIISINPVPLVALSLEGAISSHSSKLEFDMPYGQTGPLAFALHLLLGMGVLWAVSIGVLTLASARFASINARSA
ncbi:MAG: hypothetical protein AB7K52_11690 [Phycisphaerales bacterium]